MINRFEPYFKWLCLLLFGCLLYMGAYNWRDTRYEAAVQRANNLAVPLAQFNNLLQLPEQEGLVRQVNEVLKDNGYGTLARAIVLDNNAKDSKE